jgi:hypothetical protein
MKDCLFGWMKVLRFINSLSSLDFNNGEYKEPKADMQQRAEVYTSPNLETIMSSLQIIRKEKNIGLLCIRNQVQDWLF